MSTHDGPADRGFSYRLRQAVKALELERGSDISQEELGAMVGAEMKRPAFSGVSVHRWLKGQRPSYEAMVALAKVLHLSPGWLAFGENNHNGGNGQHGDHALVTKSAAAAAVSKAAVKQPGRSAGAPGRRQSGAAG